VFIFLFSHDIRLTNGNVNCSGLRAGPPLANR
jgi:hypothetical protein